MNIKEINVNALEIGNILINLGKVLEIEEQPTCYSVVITRNKEKQVFKFSLNENLTIIDKS